MMAPKSRAPILRFLDLTNIDRPEDCWDWHGNKSHNGYGRFAVTRDKTVRAHRYSYKFFKGDIPEGLLVLHSCDNPACVNPKHLRLGTYKDNYEDSMARGRVRLANGQIR